MVQIVGQLDFTWFFVGMPLVGIRFGQRQGLPLHVNHIRSKKPKLLGLKLAAHD